MKSEQIYKKVEELVCAGDSFSRRDESADAIFYSRDRFVHHLDTLALSTVKKVIGTLVVEERPAILDLMAGWDSHIPDGLNPSEVVGLGLNENELARNQALTGFVLHDVNAIPMLPFPDERFDIVLNTVSVDYMTKPFQVFREVGRVLKPGGLFLVIFSNRMFPEKVVRIWDESSEPERVRLVEDFFGAAGIFEKPRHFVSAGRPRPKNDKYAGEGIPSDPVYALYAEKPGAPGERDQRPEVTLDEGPRIPDDELERRKAAVKEALTCPHCEERMKKWRVPDSPFIDWTSEFMYICFNDACPFLAGGWQHMSGQGNVGLSCRLMFNPERGTLMSLPVPSLTALKGGIVEEG